MQRKNKITSIYRRITDNNNNIKKQKIMVLAGQWKMAAEACFIEDNETSFTVEPIWKEYMETHPCEVACFYELEKDELKV